MISDANSDLHLRALGNLLDDCDPALGAAPALQRLIDAGFDRLPRPGSGATLARWRVLARVAAHDLSLAKLFEGHTDALAILDELEDGSEQAREPAREPAVGTNASWCVWAAEAPQGKTWIRDGDGRLGGGGRVSLHGAKCWCSGAASASHALLTAWREGESSPQLVRVAIRQPGVRVDDTSWKAVGMAGSASLDVSFDGATAEIVGAPGAYLTRPGFWQGGAGIAACWFGGASVLGAALLRAVRRSGDSINQDFRIAACGKVDLELRSTAATLREVGQWIDAHPAEDACAPALRARLAAERCARLVLDQVGQALGAGPFCRDAHFARMAADLPVFIRQSHAERDFATLGAAVAANDADAWLL